MTIEADDRDLELTRVFGLTARALMRRPISALLLAGATMWLPSVLFLHFVPPPPENVFSFGFARYAFALVSLGSLSAILGGWIALHLVGAARSPIVEVMRRGVSWSVTSFVVTLIAIVGLFALVIPGLIWSLATAVVIPAAAVERLGTMQAITRSFDLAEKRRWAVLGFSIAVILPPMLAVGLFELVLNDWHYLPAEENPFITNISRPVTDTLVGMWGAALGAALYVELTRFPPGPGADGAATKEEATP